MEVSIFVAIFASVKETDMKIKRNIKIEEITHDELVDLFSTALCGSNKFGADYDTDWHKNLPDAKKQGDCFEDALADVLLNGGSIRIVDLLAEGEKYGNLSFEYVEPYTFDVLDPSEDEKDDCCVAYSVDLDAVIDGLESACGSKDEWIREAADRFIDDERFDFDLDDGETLLQIITFGEVIYG